MSDTEKRLSLARTDLQEIQAARDSAARRLERLRDQVGLEHATVEELAKGQVPNVAAAAAALQELERRSQEQAKAVLGMEADLRREQAAVAAGAYLAKLGEFIDQLDAFDEWVTELVQMRHELTQIDPFSTAPGLARLVASITELRLQYDVATGARYSFAEEEPRVEMVLVDGESVPRSEWDARPRTVSKGEMIASFFPRKQTSPF